MKKVFAWFKNNNIQIAWFLIGYFVSIGLTALAKGNWGGAGVALGLAGLNYVLNRK
jgi:hypothetical protein